MWLDATSQAAVRRRALIINTSLNLNKDTLALIQKRQDCSAQHVFKILI